VLARALDKNPATRFGSMQEFARAVEAVGLAARELSATASFAPPPPEPRVRVAAHETIVDPIPIPRPRPAAVPAAAPQPIAIRGRLTTLTGSLALAPFVAAGCTLPWVVFPFGEWSLLGRVFVLSTLLSWIILAVARKPAPTQTTWGQRFHMLIGGAVVGAVAFWLDGWVIPRGATAADTSRDLVIMDAMRFSPELLSTAARYLFYFGLTVAACRWWRFTDAARRKRVRLWPVIATTCWAGIFLFLWPWEAAPVTLAFAPLVIAAVVVQAASARAKVAV
jgi:hypothetical protein